MKNLIVILMLLVFQNAQAQEYEDEPVTDAQFQAHQKKEAVKNAKTPALPMAGQLANSKVGQVYRAVFLGEGIGSIEKEKNIGIISYFNFDIEDCDGSGQGHYIVHCNVDKFPCTQFVDFGNEGQSISAKVKHIGQKTKTLKNGNVVNAPILEVVELKE